MKNLFLAANNSHAVSLVDKYGIALIKPRNSIDLIPSLITPIIADFIKLINSPPEFRSKWLVDADKDNDPDDGLIERNGGDHDHKFFFHYKDEERISPLIKERIKNDDDYINVKLFFSKLKFLHSSLLSEMEEFVRFFDSRHPEYGLFRRTRSQPKGNLAVLQLIYCKPGLECFGEGDYDQSLFTFHVADRHFGLVMSGNEDEIYIPKNGNLLLYPGIRSGIVSSGVIKAGYHSIAKNGLTKNEGVWAIKFLYNCDVGISTKGVSKMAKDMASVFKKH